jgi:hypothetical protein
MVPRGEKMEHEPKKDHFASLPLLRTLAAPARRQVYILDMMPPNRYRAVSYSVGLK